MLKLDFAEALAFSPDGKTIAAAADDRIILWNKDSGKTVGEKPIGTLQGTTGAVGKVAFSPDGRTLVAVGIDPTIQLWDVPNRHPIAGPLAPHTAAITDVAFSPDGTTIVTTSTDGTIQVTPVYSADPARICAKVTANPSRKEWNDLVSNVIPYTELCPGLPTASD